MQNAKNPAKSFAFRRAGKKQNHETDKLKKETKELKEKYLRALADYDNLRKRWEQEKLEWGYFANEELMKKLLPVLDNLEKAKEHFKDKSLTLIFKEFQGILKNEGLEEISAGKIFDPNLMECVEVTAGETNEEILETVLKGYKFKGKVLRPIQVKVAKKGGRNG